MKKVYWLIILSLILSCLFVFCSCGKEERLDAPKKVEVEMTTLTLKWREVKDARLYTNFVLTLLILPAAVFGFMKLLSLVGLYHDDLTMTVLLMSAAAPAAAMTCMFAEKFDGDGVYASAIVSLTSILCVVSMPLVCSLAQFY